VDSLEVGRKEAVVCTWTVGHTAGLKRVNLASVIRFVDSLVKEDIIVRMAAVRKDLVVHKLKDSDFDKLVSQAFVDKADQVARGKFVSQAFVDKADQAARGKFVDLAFVDKVDLVEDIMAVTAINTWEKLAASGSMLSKSKAFIKNFAFVVDLKIIAMDIVSLVNQQAPFEAAASWRGFANNRMQVPSFVVLKSVAVADTDQPFKPFQA
jgi:hypothetical protein